MAELSEKTVAIIAVDFVEDAELTTPRDALREAGADVKVYSPDGSPIQAVEGDTEPTQKIDVDGSFDDVDHDTIDALVVPGGTVNADRLRGGPCASRGGPRGSPCASWRRATGAPPG